MTTNNSVIVYASKGKSAVLECQVDSNNGTIAIWEAYNRTNGFTVYTNKQAINPLFSNKVKLVGNITNGEYNLQINNVSATDEGIYKYIDFSNLSESYACYVKLIIQRKYK